MRRMTGKEEWITEISSARAATMATELFERVSADFAHIVSGQDDAASRRARIDRFLMFALKKAVATEVVPWKGLGPHPPLTFGVNPLELIACAGRGDGEEVYTWLCRQLCHTLHLEFHPDDPKGAELPSHHFRFGPRPVELWRRLPLFPCGKDVLTLYEWPTELATRFRFKDALVALDWDQGMELFAENGRLPADLLSGIIMLAGEPQILKALIAGKRDAWSIALWGTDIARPDQAPPDCYGPLLPQIGYYDRATRLYPLHINYISIARSNPLTFWSPI